MENNKQKFSKKYKTHRILGGLIGVFIIATYFLQFIIEDPDNFFIYFLIVAAISVVYIIILVVFVNLSWKYIEYEFKEDSIELKKGIIFKKKQVLYYNKIHAIDIKRPFLSLILNTATLNIDSGSTVSNSAEISIYHEHKVIVELEKMLKEKCGKAKETPTETNEVTEVSETLETKELQTTPDVKYEYRFKEKFLSLVLSFGFWIANIGILFGFLAIIIAQIVESGVSEIIMRLLLLAVLCIGVLILLWISSIIGLIFQYFQYMVTKDGDSIIIEYGLFSKVKHTLAYKRIKGISVHQNLLQRAFKYCSIQLEVVGFDTNPSDQDKVTGVFVPLCKLSKVNEILEMFLPEYSFKVPTIKSEKKTYKYYITAPIVITSLVFVPVFIISVLCNFWLIALITYIVIILLIMLLTKLSQHCQGIDVDEENVYLSNGVFHKKYLTIKKTNVISIGKITTTRRQNNNVLSIYVDYYNTALKNREKVAMINEKQLDDEIFSKIKTL